MKGKIKVPLFFLSDNMKKQRYYLPLKTLVSMHLFKRSDQLLLFCQFQAYPKKKRFLFIRIIIINQIGNKFVMRAKEEDRETVGIHGTRIVEGWERELVIFRISKSSRQFPHFQTNSQNESTTGPSNK